ncbi:MAG TPA: ribonuclease HII [Chloroflexi bacterium]|nr:ribonuclease HII [Chloroflexota bacterium]
MAAKPHLLIETAVTHPPAVYTHIAGLDEAGRGALAGPVVAAAVILPLDSPDSLYQLEEVNDSKQLTPKSREVLFSRITHHATAFAVGIVPAQTIDLIGIIPATKEAMRTAAAQLTTAPDYLLIDGRIRLTTLNIPQQSIIRGDSQSLSIAAASIIAKVTRDRLMAELDSQYPQYGFARHKGYGTKMHRRAIAQFGPCPQHRHSFSPIRQPLV